MLMTQKNFGRALLLTAAAGTLAGCGTASYAGGPLVGPHSVGGRPLSENLRQTSVGLIRILKRYS